VVGALDVGIGSVKTRARGATGGQLLAGLAAAQWCGAKWLSGGDLFRADGGSVLLTAAPIPASTTAGGLARRISAEQLRGIETGLARVYDRWLATVPAATRAQLLVRSPTIDIDATDIEVYGKHKQQVAFNYAGVRTGRVHLASWAGAELPLAADLIAGNDDPRPDAPDLLRRALAVLPAAVCGRPRVRADAGYFDAKLAWAARDADCDYAIAAKRNTAAWRAYAAIGESAWVAARDMPGAQVAACDYAPAGWPPGTYTIVRRVRVDADQISADPRSRRRRTIAKDQLRLALEGIVDHSWAVSFIVTDIPADDTDMVGIEAWFRGRVSVEERIREGKLGAGLLHLPSAEHDVNSVWMWAGLLAGALNVMLVGLTGAQSYVRHPNRVHIDTLRRHLLATPARIIRHARGLTLRLPTGRSSVQTTLTKLRGLPAPAY
jgi:Transposase DDE domain group 1